MQGVYLHDIRGCPTHSLSEVDIFIEFSTTPGKSCQSSCYTITSGGLLILQVNAWRSFSLGLILIFVLLPKSGYNISFCIAKVEKFGKSFTNSLIKCYMRKERACLN